MCELSERFYFNYKPWIISAVRYDEYLFLERSVPTPHSTRPSHLTEGFLCSHYQCDQDLNFRSSRLFIYKQEIQSLRIILTIADSGPQARLYKNNTILLADTDHQRNTPRPPHALRLPRRLRHNIQSRLQSRFIQIFQPDTNCYHPYYYSPRLFLL